MKKILLFLLLMFSATGAMAKNKNMFYPAAVFNFSEKGSHLTGMGEKISTLLFANLVTSPLIELVDREELAKILDEATLSLSGMVNQNQAIQVGQLTGAKIIISGTVFEVENTLMIVAKVIGTETSRVLGASVKGEADDKLTDLIEKLSQKIITTISTKADVLVATPAEKKDRIALLKTELHTKEKPVLAIEIKERHINRGTIDPAAETEMIYIAKEAGFEVLDSKSDRSRKADILITGEGFTEFATRKGDIIGVKARLEVKAIDQKTRKVIAIDRQTEIDIDLSELIASKKALEAASAKIAERMLIKLVNKALK